MTDPPDLPPPPEVAEIAEKALALRREFGRGGTGTGVARDLRNRRSLSPRTIDRMMRCFQRHKADRRGRTFGNDDDPSAGYVAWLLWGGDAGRDWDRDRQDRLPSGQSGVRIFASRD